MTIITEDINNSFTNKIISEESCKKLFLCINCNGCSTGCPMTNIAYNFNIKKYIRMASLGFERNILDDKYLWYCTTCYKCQERCPEEIHNVDILLKLRTMAVSNVASNVIKTGHAVPLNDSNKNKRKQLGLSEIPPTVHKFKNELYNIQKLIKLCKFDKLINYDE